MNDALVRGLIACAAASFVIGPRAVHGEVEAVKVVRPSRMLGFPCLLPAWLPYPRYAIYSVAYSPDGKTIAAGRYGGEVHLFDDKTGVRIHRIDTKCEYVQSIAFSPDGRVLASGGKGLTIRLWDAVTGKETGTLPAQADEIDKALAYAPPFNELHYRRHLEGERGVKTLAFSPRGGILVSGGHDDDGILTFWDVPGKEEIRSIKAHHGGVDGICFSPDGGIVASGGRDRAIRLWDGATSRPLGVLVGHRDIVTSLAFSPDGHRLYSVGMDDTLKVWDVGKKLLLDSSNDLGMTYHNLAPSPDGRLIAVSAGHPKADWVLLYGADDLRLRARLRAFDRSGACSLAFSPDGKRLAAGSWDRVVQVFRVGHIR